MYLTCVYFIAGSHTSTYFSFLKKKKADNLRHIFRMNSRLNFVLNKSGIVSIICKNPNMNETKLYKTKCTSLETYSQNTEVYEIPDRELVV